MSCIVDETIATNGPEAVSGTRVDQEVSLQEQRQIHQVHKKCKKILSLTIIMSRIVDETIVTNGPEAASLLIHTSGKEYHSQAGSTTPETAGLSFLHCSTPSLS